MYLSEFNEKHHKYKIVNSNINKDKAKADHVSAGGSGSTTKRVIR